VKAFKIKEYSEITLGVIILMVGFYFFLLPQKMVVGGVMGIAILLEGIISPSLFIFIANAVLLVVGLIFLGKSFFVKTVYASLLAPVIVWMLELTVANDIIMKEMTESPLMAAMIFGGILVGLGLGIVIRNNATTGGMDVIQHLVHKYLHIPFTTAMYASDGIIIIVAMSINFQLGLYAIGAMIVSGAIIDRISIDGKSGYTAFIVTKFASLMRDEIYQRLDRGITKVKVVGGYSNEDKEMIICTINKLQFYNFKRIIKQVDPDAFTFVTKTKEALGEGFSRSSDALWRVKN
jgi:uncharacterized membrane-anchored protein YitT (DUF2179 family)